MPLQSESSGRGSGRRDNTNNRRREMMDDRVQEMEAMDAITELSDEEYEDVRNPIPVKSGRVSKAKPLRKAAGTNNNGQSSEMPLKIGEYMQ